MSNPKKEIPSFKQVGHRSILGAITTAAAVGEVRKKADAQKDADAQAARKSTCLDSIGKHD